MKKQYIIPTIEVTVCNSTALMAGSLGTNNTPSSFNLNDAGEQSGVQANSKGSIWNEEE